MDQQFPRQAWRLLPSYRPKEITLTGIKARWGMDYYHVDGHASISTEDVWPTQAEAIAAGHQRLDDQQKVLDKRITALNKRRAQLLKAAT